MHDPQTICWKTWKPSNIVMHPHLEAAAVKFVIWKLIAFHSIYKRSYTAREQFVSKTIAPLLWIILWSHLYSYLPVTITHFISSFYLIELNENSVSEPRKNKTLKVIQKKKRTMLIEQ